MTRRLLGPTGLIGTIVLTAIVVLSLSRLGLGPQGRVAVDARAIGVPPLTPGHPFGTDSMGRDVLGMIVQGGQTSLLVGVVAALVALAVGVLVGTAAAMGPRWLDEGLMRLVDIALTLPFLVVLIALRGVIEPGPVAIAAIIGAFSWMGVARVARAQIVGISVQGYVRSAYASGASFPRTLFTHILPNALPAVIAMASFVVSAGIIAEATLSFLGLGVPRTAQSWGTVLSGVHREMLLGHWWVLAFTGGILALTVAAINMIATELQRR